MLHSENEYKAALKKLRQNEETLKIQREHFLSLNLTEEQIIFAYPLFKAFIISSKQKW